jgi:putative transposase
MVFLVAIYCSLPQGIDLTYTLQQTKHTSCIVLKTFYQELEALSRSNNNLTGSGLSVMAAPKSRHHKVKKKNSSGSAQWSSGGIRSLNKLNRKYSSIELQKSGRESFNLKYRDTRELPSKPSSVTLLKDKLGRYWISFVVKQPIAIPKNSGSALGVDLGLTDLVAVVSTNGERYKVSSPKYYRQAEYKLKRLQQKHARKNKGSKNEEKARLKLAKQHSKVTNRRKDAYQKLAFKMASESQAICLETLNTIGMLKNRKLAKSISDASWGTLNQSIKNQAEKQGVQILRCSQFTATSQICSYCWLGSGKKPLAVREWTCECGAVLDRDFNAGVNILLAARHADTINDCGPDIRLGLARAVGSETVTSSLADFLKTS